MNVFEKLNALERIAQENVEDKHLQYLVEVLGDHAHDEKMSTSFFAWLKQKT